MVDAQTIGVLVTAASVTVAAIYYIMTLRTTQRNMKLTLETRRLQFLTSIIQELQSEEGWKRYGELLNMEWRDYDDFERKYGSDFNLDNFSKRMSSLGIYNFLGSVIRMGLVEPEDVYSTEVIGALYTWNKLEAVIKEARRRYTGADWLSDFEYFSKEMLRIKKQNDPAFDIPKTFIKYVPEV